LITLGVYGVQFQEEVSLFVSSLPYPGGLSYSVSTESYFPRVKRQRCVRGFESDTQEACWLRHKKTDCEERKWSRPIL